MDNLLKFLDGNKTYIVALLIGLNTTAHAMGWITLETKNTIDGVLYSLGVVTIRHAISKGK